MTVPIILASGSSIRADMLRRAGVAFDVVVPRVDEDGLRAAMEAEDATPRDIADALAEMKALRISEKHPDALVLGCDQVLDFQGEVFAKPATRDAAKRQLQVLRGARHKLLSAAVIAQHGRPVWRRIGTVTLEMRAFSDRYLEDYLDRNWPAIGQSVGSYMLEEEGVRLMARVDGDYFTVLGMPLVDILGYLTAREAIAG